MIEMQPQSRRHGERTECKGERPDRNRTLWLKVRCHDVSGGVRQTESTPFQILSIMSRTRDITVPDFYLPQRLGEILCRSGLISIAQLEVALYDQHEYNHIRLGEILALRGWVKQQTADFFADKWPYIRVQENRHRLGYYFRQAALLDSSQIETILTEQQQKALRFGTLAVLHGWIAQQTLDFFLDALFPAQASTVRFPEEEVKLAIGERTEPETTGEQSNLIIDPRETIPVDDFSWLG